MEDKDIFISYRWADPDKTWVRDSLVPALQAAGLSVFIDIEDFIPGRDIMLEMERAGITSKHILCIISENYFQEDRFVWFESLQARKRDPSGRNSTLIPFIIQKTKIPDWINGLVPIDWTLNSNTEREWHKLLSVLNAPYIVPPPSSPHTSILKTITDIIPKSKLQWKRLIPLQSADEIGFGWDISFENIGDKNIEIDSVKIKGEFVISIRGLMGMHNRTKYTVVLNSISKVEDKLQLKAIAFEDSDLNWGRICQGNLEFINSTSEGKKSWKYDFEIPIEFNC
ncbi:MAG: toll/interleukin-1 receptor domain-containing protein, partial [Holophaga sp.]